MNHLTQFKVLKRSFIFFSFMSSWSFMFKNFNVFDQTSFLVYVCYQNFYEIIQRDKLQFHFINITSKIHHNDYCNI